jgi:uncharacterized membrane protein
MISMHSRKQVPIMLVLLPVIVGSVWATALVAELVGITWMTLLGVWYAYGITMVVLVLCLLKIWRKSA